MASFRNHRDNPSHLLCMGFISSGISITFSNFILKNHFQFLVELLYYIFVDCLNLFLIKVKLKDAIIVVSSRTDCLLPLRGHVFLCVSLIRFIHFRSSNLYPDVSLHLNLHFLFHFPIQT